MENLENPVINVENHETLQVDTQKKRKIKRYCSVPQCPKRNTGSLHRFPKDIELRNKWIKACQFTKNITNYTSVCNDHFLPSDFIPRWDRQLKRLKCIAVPSQNLPEKKYAKKLSPAQKKKVEERAERAAKRLKREDPRYEKLIAMKEKLDDKKSEEVVVKDERLVVPKPNLDVVHIETENITQNIVITPKSQNVVNSKRKVYIVKQEANPVKFILEHNYSNIVCKCNKDDANSSNSSDSPEIRGARALVELNVKVFEMIKNNEINFAVKDVILKIGEDFYNAARKYYKKNISWFMKNHQQLYYYTGIDSNLLKDLETAMLICEGDFADNQDLTVSERIILCFMKLRLNFSFSVLGGLFHIDQQTCEKVFYSTIQTLKVILRSAIYWPTKDEILKSMPESFEYLKKTITVLDRTEIEIDKSICPDCKLPHVLIYDKYLKVLLGFSNSGLITYVSRAIHGRTSNETITDQNYISKVLVPSRDAIMTDGFFMEEECNRKFIDCIKKRKEKPFCPEAALKIQSKNVIETHIENAYRRFNMFKIFHTVIPHDMVPYIDDISVVTCGIVNLSNQSVAMKKFE